MSSITTIHEALLNRREQICHKKEILEILKEYNKKIRRINITNTIKYLTRHNYLRRIYMQYYYINTMEERKRNFCRYEDKELLFAVLGKIKIKWYLGLSTALYSLGKIWQTPARITIINNKVSGKKKILSLNARFIKIKENLIFGLKKAKTKHNITYQYSDLAKTYLDKVYYKEIEQVKLNKKTKKYSKHYPPWLKKLIYKNTLQK